MQKQPVGFNFSQGINTKTDPWQLPLGQFESLTNSVFTVARQLKKRNGFPSLSNLPNNSAKYLTTLNDNLTAIGDSIEAYSQSSMTWVNKGNIEPITLSVLPTVRSDLSQIQCDSVVASNGLVCTVFTEINDTTLSYKYTISDSETGQNIINPTIIPIGSGAITGSPRVFALGGYFIIAFTNTISAVAHLQYIAISINSPSVVTANADLAAAYIPASTLSWDGVVVGNKLYFAYNTTTGGQQIKLAYLSSSLVLSSTVSFSSQIATMMSLCVDNSNPVTPIIYAAYYDSAGSTGNVLAIDLGLNKRMSPTEIISSGTVYNITCTAYNGIQTIAYEVANVYSYDNNLPTNFLDKVSVTLPATVTTGTVGSTTTFIRSVGLASKACLINNTMYVLTEYASSLQSTYFLIDINGNVVSRFAYENGGANLVVGSGYLQTGLPQAQVIGSTVKIAYLYKDLIESQSTAGLVQSIGPAGISNIYSQTGINLISLDFTTDTLISAEIGAALNLSGGFLWDFDGQTVAEENFHLFPDNIEATIIADPAPTGTVSNITTPTVITAVSSVAGIAVGMNISGTGIPANTTVVSVGTTTVTMSNAATGAHSAETITFTGNLAAQDYWYQVIYEWTNASGNIVRSAPSVPVKVTASSGHTSSVVNIPTLRLSYKTGIKIIVYRWSTAQEIYYQETSIIAPLLNDPTTDSISYADIKSDAQILGNSIIYTTGGVVENIAGPSFIA